jgi:hypothetical protein
MGPAHKTGSDQRRWPQGGYRTVLIAAVALIAATACARAVDPFQSAPGPGPNTELQSAPGPETQQPKARPNRSAPSSTPPAIAPAPVSPAPSNPDLALSRHVPSGVPGKLEQESAFDHTSCTGISVYVKIVEPPRSGTVTIRDATGPIPAKPRWGPTPPACIGREIPKKAIYYQSNPGFRGADRLGYLRSTGDGEWKRASVSRSIWNDFAAQERRRGVPDRTRTCDPRFRKPETPDLGRLQRD